VSPDRFNLQATKTLSMIIDRWIGEHAQIYGDFKKLGLPIKLGKPVFLGIISQHFKISKGLPKPGYKLWMERIPLSIHENLFPVLGYYSDKDVDLTFGLEKEEITVTEIPDFGSLATVSQEYGKAIFQVERQDTSIVTESGYAWTGGTWKDAQKRIALYKSKFEEIEKRLIV
jgi:hypothetical protein